MGENWIPVGAKYTLARRIRDLFDDTERDRLRKLGKRSKKSNNSFLQPEQKISNDNRIIVKTLENSVPPVEHIVTVSEPEKVIVKKQIPVTVYKPVLNWKDISIPFPKFSRKEWKIKIPKIKMNMTNLKKLGWLSIIITMIIVTALATFGVVRIVDVTDGNFLPEVYRYKVDQAIKERITPLEAQMQKISDIQNKLEAQEDARYFREVTHTPIPRPKTYTIRDAASGKILRVEVK